MNERSPTLVQPELTDLAGLRKGWLDSEAGIQHMCDVLSDYEHLEVTHFIKTRIILNRDLKSLGVEL